MTWIPASILEAIGVAGAGRWRIVLADGRRIERDTGNAAATLDGNVTACRVVFGVPGDATLLGLTALEQLGLAVDPVDRRLVPAEFRA